MSGMSGSISSFPAVSCERLTFTTVLVNPDMEILPTLSVGDVLVISVDTTMGFVASKDGHIVGGIQYDPSTIDKLISCMDGGTQYGGEIIELNITEGICRVRVFAKV